MKKYLIFFLFVTAYFNSVAQPLPLLTLTGHSESVNTVVFSKDGKYLYSGGKDHTLRMWDVNLNFSNIKTVEPGEASVTNLSLSTDGKKLLAAGYKNFYVYDAQTLKKVAKKKKAHSTFLKTATYSNNGRHIITSSWRDNTLIMWSADKLKKELVFAETEWTDYATFTTDDKYVVSCNHKDVAKIWDVATGNVIRTFAGHEGWVYSASITKDQHWLITSSGDNTIKLWDFSSGKLEATLNGHTDGVVSVILSPDEKYLASCSLDKTIRIWKMKDRTLITTLTDHQGQTLSASFSPDGKYLATASEDKTIKIWNFPELVK